MAKLAVFFPGIGYTVDKPLLYYSRKLAAARDYEIRLLPYGGFPPKIKGDRARMAESAALAYRQAEDMLADLDLRAYEALLFVGKSIGTVAAAKLAAAHGVTERARFVLYTPLEETFTFPLGQTIVFTGGADPWVGGAENRIPGLCAARGIPCHVIPDANHSLECGDVRTDLKNLRAVMKETERFLEP
ncbi:MAG: alpha/beta hydrolase [Oscillospiraceae bacterium]|nr:alpha/beta hydrolase [Oscillospiraceae bacterium]